MCTDCAATGMLRALGYATRVLAVPCASRCRRGFPCKPQWHSHTWVGPPHRHCARAKLAPQQACRPVRLAPLLRRRSMLGGQLAIPDFRQSRWQHPGATTGQQRKPQSPRPRRHRRHWSGCYHWLQHLATSRTTQRHGCHAWVVRAPVPPQHKGRGESSLASPPGPWPPVETQQRTQRDPVRGVSSGPAQRAVHRRTCQRWRVPRHGWRAPAPRRKVQQWGVDPSSIEAQVNVKFRPT